MAKNFYIITNRLTKYITFFEEVKKQSFFTTHIINYKDFLSPEYRKILKSLNRAEVVILISRDFYSRIKEEFTEYIKSFFLPGFNNIMFIYTHPGIMTQGDVMSGTMHSYYLYQEQDFSGQIINFLLYVTKIFNEATLSGRLLDYITTSIEGIVKEELLKKKKKEIEGLYKELEVISKTDSLTNIFNRKTIFEFLDHELERTKRDLFRIENSIKKESHVNIHTYGNDNNYTSMGEILDHYGVFSLLMIDVDHFKQVNDTHGHLVGDQVLRSLGELLVDKEIFRANDISGRIGGEEFIVILPETNVNNALGPAVRFMKKLSSVEFVGRNNCTFKITVSIGISESTPGDVIKDDILKRADKAMYWAKEHGRDQIVVYEKIFDK